MGRKKKYNTEEERKAARKERNRRYRQKHKEKICEQKAEYRKNNKEKIAERGAEYRKNNREKIAERMAEYMAEYRSTKYGRAKNLLGSYRRVDKKYNRGECTLTADWIVDNIFSGQGCVYCGESDWRKLGCDRIDNSKPHTPENCVPCCHACNIKKSTTPYDVYMKRIGKIA